VAGSALGRKVSRNRRLPRSRFCIRDITVGQSSRGYNSVDRQSFLGKIGPALDENVMVNWGGGEGESWKEVLSVPLAGSRKDLAAAWD